MAIVLLPRDIVVFSSVKGMGLKFAEITKEQHEVLEKWLGPLRERHWLILNRRKTQRVLEELGCEVQHTSGSHFDEETDTSRSMLMGL